MSKWDQIIGRVTLVQKTLKEAAFVCVFVGLDVFLPEKGLNNPLHFYDPKKFYIFKL